MYCRTGSLEIIGKNAVRSDTVYCRTGSLEILYQVQNTHRQVYCRTGSLESIVAYFNWRLVVYCRTGSLESQHSHLPTGFQNWRLKCVDENNECVFYEDRDSCDIPEYCRLDIRVQMPEDSVWNLKQKELQEEIEGIGEK